MENTPKRSKVASRKHAKSLLRTFLTWTVLPRLCVQSAGMGVVVVVMMMTMMTPRWSVLPLYGLVFLTIFLMWFLMMRRSFLELRRSPDLESVVVDV